MSFDNTSPEQRALRALAKELKAAVRALATTNVTIASTGNNSFVGGVTLATGNRLALTGQTSGPTNGLYDVGASSLSRSADANSAAEFNAFQFDVTEGTYAGQRWQHTTTGAITLGTTTLSFATPTAPSTKTPSRAAAFDNTAPGTMTV